MTRANNLLKIILIIIIFGLTARLQAARVDFMPYSVTQPNGEALNVFASGDEYYNWLHDADGYTIIQSKQNGYYYYAVYSGENLVPSSYLANKVNPASVGIPKWVKLSPEKIEDIRRSFTPPPKPLIEGKKDKPQVSNFGLFNNLVVYIRFSDQSEFSDPISFFDNQFNAVSTASLYSYYKEATYNQLSISTSFYPVPSGSVIVSYQDPNPRNYYSPYNSTTNPIGYTDDNQSRDREHLLLLNAINAVNSQIPSNLNIDNDNDGYVDNVAFMVNGTNDAWANLLWPHMWALYTQDAYINNKRVWIYNFLLESWAHQSRSISVLCHEMFHSLGAPDLYHYTSNGIRPVGPWDIMEQDQTPPQHMSAYMKYKYGGWITNIPEITQPGQYTLNPLTSSTNNCFKIKSPNSPSQFFVVEYRKKAGMCEISLPGSGLLVYRIDSIYNGNASGPPDEVYLFRPDGAPTVNGIINNANFSSDVARTEISSSTNPYPFLQDGSAGGLHIFDVGTCGSTINFKVTFGVNSPTLVLPANGDTTVPVMTGFSWNSVKYANSYTLQAATDAGFTNIVLAQTGIVGNSYTPSARYFNYNSTYYWRVQAVSTYETSAWSTVWSFRTSIEPPVVISEPSSQIICFGTNTSLTVVNQGQNVIHQWQKDGVAVPGANKPVYIIANSSYDKSGLYRCQLTNPPYHDTVYTSTVLVYVSGKPKIMSQPQTISAALGDTVTFEFQAHIEGLPPTYQPEVQWYRGTKALQDNDRIAGARSSILSIRDIRESDYGSDYWFIIKGLCGSDTSGMYSLLNMPGVDITGQPADVTICEGSRIVLNVSAVPKNGGLTLSYQWQKNGVALTDGGNISGATSSTLTINPAVPADDGNYMVIVTVSPGNTRKNSSPAVVSIKAKPFIVKQPSGTYDAQTGKTFSIDIEAGGYQPLTYRWIKDSVNVITGQTSATLTIDTASAGAAGKYMCQISNECGTITTIETDVTVSLFNI
ncbi:MAG: hypothetical protein QG635_1345, partial [Bacteroidota bacterium]|nr:hypothetical protein [Bacteroidota bacterium]